MGNNNQERKAFWCQIGRAFPQKDKQGFNLVLNALPNPVHQTVIRKVVPEEGEPFWAVYSIVEPREKSEAPRSSGNNRGNNNNQGNNRGNNNRGKQQEEGEDDIPF